MSQISFHGVENFLPSINVTKTPAHPYFKSSAVPNDTQTTSQDTMADLIKILRDYTPQKTVTEKELSDLQASLEKLKNTHQDDIDKHTKLEKESKNLLVQMKGLDKKSTEYKNLQKQRKEKQTQKNDLEKSSQYYIVLKGSILKKKQISSRLKAIKANIQEINLQIKMMVANEKAAAAKAALDKKIAIKNAQDVEKKAKIAEKKAKTALKLLRLPKQKIKRSKGDKVWEKYTVRQIAGAKKEYPDEWTVLNDVITKIEHEDYVIRNPGLVKQNAIDKIKSYDFIKKMTPEEWDEKFKEADAEAEKLAKEAEELRLNKKEQAVFAATQKKLEKLKKILEEKNAFLQETVQILRGTTGKYIVDGDLASLDDGQLMNAVSNYFSLKSLPDYPDIVSLEDYLEWIEAELEDYDETGNEKKNENYLLGLFLASQEQVNDQKYFVTKRLGLNDQPLTLLRKQAYTVEVGVDEKGQPITEKMQIPIAVKQIFDVLTDEILSYDSDDDEYNVDDDDDEFYKKELSELEAEDFWERLSKTEKEACESVFKKTYGAGIDSKETNTGLVRVMIESKVNNQCVKDGAFKFEGKLTDQSVQKWSDTIHKILTTDDEWKKDKEEFLTNVKEYVRKTLNASLLAHGVSGVEEETGTNQGSSSNIITEEEVNVARENVSKINSELLSGGLEAFVTYVSDRSFYTMIESMIFVKNFIDDTSQLEKFLNESNEKPEKLTNESDEDYSNRILNDFFNYVFYADEEGYDDELEQNKEFPDTYEELRDMFTNNYNLGGPIYTTGQFYIDMTTKKQIAALNGTVAFPKNKTKEQAVERKLDAVSTDLTNRTVHMLQARPKKRSKTEPEKGSKKRSGGKVIPGFEPRPTQKQRTQNPPAEYLYDDGFLESLLRDDFLGLDLLPGADLEATFDEKKSPSSYHVTSNW